MVLLGCLGFLACGGILRGSRGLNIYVVSPLSLGYKILFMLRLWEPFWY